jgi:hypothetical protein
MVMARLCSDEIGYPFNRYHASLSVRAITKDAKDFFCNLNFIMFERWGWCILLIRGERGRGEAKLLILQAIAITWYKR